MELGPFGLSEVLFIAVLALMIFGPRRLPEIGHALGRITAKLRRATNELRTSWEAELDDESKESMREASRQLRSVRDELSSAGREAWRGGTDAVASVRAAAAEAGSALNPAPALPPPSASPTPGVPPPASPPPAASPRGEPADEP